jgi:hypothetical protein
MRSEEEIRRVFDLLGEVGDDPTEPDPTNLDELPVNAWQDDTFKYGYLMGKLEALAWVLGDRNSAAINCHYDYAGYITRIPGNDSPGE